MLVLVGGLGTAWMVHMAKSSPCPDKAAAISAAPATNVASLNTTPEPPPSKLPENNTHTPASAAAPVAAPIPVSGSELWFCCQGKVPEDWVLVVDKARQRLLMLRYLSEISLDYEYICITGMQQGFKQSESDKRTPEGIYFTGPRRGRGGDGL